MPRDLTEYVRNKAIRTRFLSNIAFCEHGRTCNQCCWLYTGSKDTGGYGLVHLRTVSKKVFNAQSNRFMWTLKKGHTDKLVLHTCDVRSCVNIHHLYAGSHKDNMQDRITRNRANMPKGEEHPNSKLTPKIVRQIKELRRQGLTYRSIGLRYGITTRHVMKIIRREQWKHLD